MGYKEIHIIGGLKMNKNKDIDILKALYYGNHLNNDELERAYKLVYLLKVDLGQRVKTLNE